MSTHHYASSVEPFDTGAIAYAIRRAREAGKRRIVIQGDPNAAGFYRAAGAVPDGERESDSIPGRYLPLFVIELA